MSEFDTQALFAAIDAERLQRGLTWSDVRREINAPFSAAPGHRGLAVSTIRRLAERTEAEGDGVLQMLLWLDRTPESFVPGFPGAGARRFQLPRVEPGLILRFDTAAMHQALEHRRQQDALSWKAIAEQIGTVSAAQLSNLAGGGRTAIRPAVAIAGWLGRPTAAFTRAAQA